MPQARHIPFWLCGAVDAGSVLTSWIRLSKAFRIPEPLDVSADRVVRGFKQQDQCCCDRQPLSHPATHPYPRGLVVPCWVMAEHGDREAQILEPECLVSNPDYAPCYTTVMLSR